MIINFYKGQGGGGSYTLPIASQETLGGIKVGENLSIDANGVLSADGGKSPRKYEVETVEDMNALTGMSIGDICLVKQWSSTLGDEVITPENVDTFEWTNIWRSNTNYIFTVASNPAGDCKMIFDMADDSWVHQVGPFGLQYNNGAWEKFMGVEEGQQVWVPWDYNPIQFKTLSKNNSWPVFEGVEYLVGALSLRSIDPTSMTFEYVDGMWQVYTHVKAGKGITINGDKVISIDKVQERFEVEHMQDMYNLQSMHDGDTCVVMQYSGTTLPDLITADFLSDKNADLTPYFQAGTVYTFGRTTDTPSGNFAIALDVMDGDWMNYRYGIKYDNGQWFKTDEVGTMELNWEPWDGTPFSFQAPWTMQPEWGVQFRWDIEQQDLSAALGNVSLVGASYISHAFEYFNGQWRDSEQQVGKPKYILNQMTQEERLALYTYLHADLNRFSEIEAYYLDNGNGFEARYTSMEDRGSNGLYFRGIRSNAADVKPLVFVTGRLNPNGGFEGSGGKSIIDTLPYASTSQVGVVKVGSGLSIDGSGVLSVSGLQELTIGNTTVTEAQLQALLALIEN